jgi:hypothetical protein
MLETATNELQDSGPSYQCRRRERERERKRDTSPPHENPHGDAEVAHADAEVFTG